MHDGRKKNVPTNNAQFSITNYRSDEQRDPNKDKAVEEQFRIHRNLRLTPHPHFDLKAHLERLLQVRHEHLRVLDDLRSLVDLFQLLLVVRRNRIPYMQRNPIAYTAWTQQQRRTTRFDSESPVQFAAAPSWLDYTGCPNSPSVWPRQAKKFASPGIQSERTSQGCADTSRIFWDPIQWRKGWGHNQPNQIHDIGVFQEAEQEGINVVDKDRSGQFEQVQLGDGHVGFGLQLQNRTHQSVNRRGFPTHFLHTLPSTSKSTLFSSVIRSLHSSISTFRLLRVRSLAKPSIDIFNCFCSSSNLSYTMKGYEESNIVLL